MQKFTYASNDAQAVARRRVQRLQILRVLQGVVGEIELLQRSDDARLACREIAELLKWAQSYEEGQTSDKKS